MAIREGRWDCTTCGTVGLPGRQVACTQCGTPRPEGVRFYLPEDAPEVDDAERLAAARAGADWVCAHCGGSARAAQEACPGCGAPRGSSPTQEVRDHALADVPRAGDESRERRAAPGPAPAAARSPMRAWGTRAAVVLLVFLGWWYFRPRELPATVAEKSWERSLEVEAYRTVRESDWTVPAGGRLVRSFRDVRSHRQELERYETRTRTVSEQVQTGTRTYVCGQRDLGNGYFEDRTCTEPVYETRSRTESYQEPIYRQVPIYDTKHEFDVERWVRDTTLVERGAVSAAGAADDPAWPAPHLTDARRAGGRSEKYLLLFRDRRDRTYQREVGLEEYRSVRVGDRVRIRVNGAGTVLAVIPGGA